VAQALAVGAIVAVLAPLGDLAESLVKRELGVKDSGRLLPGHGGMLDRLDAIIFCAPAVFLLLHFMVS
jgi:phosphatidate cytidylyltransferase